MKNNYYTSIEWKSNTPYSALHQDIYYSDESATLESNYVFIKHNNLAQRFYDLPADKNFVIAETGFGAGINFLVTAKLWQQTAHHNHQLHYVSIEKNPLNPDALQTILQNFPEYNEISQQLLEQYYLLLYGYHRIRIAKNIFLTLIIADANECLPQLDFVADAWFLDGFSPSKNQDIWDENIIRNVARLSRANHTTFATYTSSGQVRRNLEKYGFTVHKDKGFGRKREMIYGSLTDTPTAIVNNHVLYKPYLHRKIQEASPIKSIVIIGAGISGASTAYSLALRGYKVTVLEKMPDVAMAASGNYQGMLYGTWSIFPNDTMELSSSSYRYSNFLVNKLLSAPEEFQPCGLIQLAHNSRQAKRNQQLLQGNFPPEFIQKINPQQVSELSGNLAKYSENSVFFPKGLWLNPPALVNKLLSHPNITVLTNHNVIKLEHLNNYWHVYTENDSFLFDSVVICNANNIQQFAQTGYIKIRKIRGQISIATKQTEIKTVICGNGYITPNKGDKFTFGATFNFKDLSPDIMTHEHQENLTMLGEIIPQLADCLDISELDGKVGIRASSYDYLPIVGPITDATQFNLNFAKLAKDRNARFGYQCDYLPNLYVNIGHGSKGMLTAPLCGEIIADYISGTPLPISERIRQSLHPNRILVKDLVHANE